MGWRTDKIRMLGHYVLVKLDAQRTHYGSGLLETPDYWREQQTTATVIAVGPGRMDEHGVWRESGLRVGDRVMLGKYNGLVMSEPPDDDDDAEARERYWVLDMRQLWQKRGRTLETLRECDVYARVVD